MSDPAAMGIEVEVAFAEPLRAVLKSYHVAAGAFVEDVLRMAAADPGFQGIDIAHAAIGIHGRVVSLRQKLRDGDRVEIYRALAADPKIARRDRARSSRSNR